MWYDGTVGFRNEWDWIAYDWICFNVTEFGPRLIEGAS